MVDPVTALEATGVAKPIVETACALIKDLLGEPCKVFGGMLADGAYAWRWRNRIRIAERARRLLEQNDVAARVLPPGFLVPLLDTCGDAEDPELQEFWARLLAAGVQDSAHAHPLLVEALRGLDGSDARFFASIFAVGTGPVRGRLPRDVRHYLGESVSEPRDEDARRSWERLVAKGLLAEQLTGDLAEWGRQITSVISGETGGRIPSRLGDGEPFRTAVVITAFGVHLADALGLVPQGLEEHGQLE